MLTNKTKKTKTGRLCIILKFELVLVELRIGILHLERKGYKGTDNQLFSILLFCQQEA